MRDGGAEDSRQKLVVSVFPLPCFPLRNAPHPELRWSSGAVESRADWPLGGGACFDVRNAPLTHRAETSGRGQGVLPTSTGLGERVREDFSTFEMLPLTQPLPMST
jgi:hypothetical protein